MPCPRPNFHCLSSYGQGQVVKKKTVNLEVKPLPCHTETIEYNKLLGLDVLDLDGSIRAEGQNLTNRKVSLSSSG